MTPDASIVVEWENVALAGAPRALVTLARLRDETSRSARRIDVVICHDEDSPPDLSPLAAALPPGWRLLRVPDARYYQLKNHGAAATAGRIIVFLDSDAIPEAGWLEGMLAPFDDPAVQVVAGHAYIQAESLYARAFALTWFFPLRAEPEPLKPVTWFFANSVAFRRSTFLAHPFAPAEGVSRGACVQLARELREAGITIWKSTAAQVAHPAPRGWRHFALRALAEGRDRLPRERGWRATIAGSLARLAHHGGAGLWAIVRHRGKVGLSLAGVPVALGICWVYYGLRFAGEAATLLGVGAIRRVRV
jgi:Glycosyl transferase family 2